MLSGIFVPLATGCNGGSAQRLDALTPVSFESVQLQDDFWLPRLKTQKDTLVPFSLGKTQDVVENLRRVGAWTED